MEDRFSPDGDLLVTERDGLLRRVRSDGSLVEEPLAVIDIGSSDEGGLLGIAWIRRFQRTEPFSCM